MKYIFTSGLIFAALSVFGQKVVTLSSDRVMSETWIITEDTIIEGNENSISCAGCSPMISVRKGANVQFRNTYFKRDYSTWLETLEGSSASWDSKRMKGSISSRVLN